MQDMNVLMKPSSSHCNMKCEYCFYLDEAANRKESSYGFMTEETLKNVIRKTLPKAKNVISYAYQGGEPTLCGLDFYRKAIELQKKYNKNHIIVRNVFQTNGYLIDEEWCRFFKENDILVGLSVDGFADIHDSMRRTRSGEDTFRRISQSAKLMDKYGVNYNILTVVTNTVANNVREIYSYYKKRGWEYQQYIACLEPLGMEHGKQKYSLTPETYGDFLITLFGLWFEDACKGRQPYIRQFENYVGIAAGYYPEACDQKGICGMQYVVEADGSAYPCDFFVLDDYKLGNFNFDNIKEIDEKRLEIRFIEKSNDQTEECKNCQYFRLCRGGCQRNRDKQEDGRYKNYLCEGYKKFFDVCEDRIKKLANNLVNK